MMNWPDVFIWDENKRADNLRKHGVDFSVARQFDFGAATTVVDDRREYGEVRYRALGVVDGKAYVLVFTRRGDRIRIISARRAHRREVSRYAARKEEK